jgi:DnaK suppressor protein
MADDAETVRARLEKVRAKLVSDSSLAGDVRKAVELDQQAVGRLSRMDAMQDQAVAQAQERKRRHDLVRIDMALRRLEAGDYGYCAECGDEIPEARLAIDPMAECCVKCA